VNYFLEILTELKKLAIGVLLAAILIIGLGFYWGREVATQLGIGVLISAISTGFYALLAWTIIVKKNIAWMGPVIVIKYSILIASIYYVWVHQNIVLVTVGLLAQLVISALIVAVMKSREPRRFDKDTENAF